MPRIVHRPTWLVFSIENRTALASLVEQFQLDGQLHGNLRQLCGFDQAPHIKRHTAGNEWFLLEEVVFLKHAEQECIVAVVGSVADRLKTMQQHHPSIDPLAFKKLVNGQRKADLDGWEKMDEESQQALLMHLKHGDSLVDLPVASVRASTPPSSPSARVSCSPLTLFSFAYACRSGPAISPPPPAPSPPRLPPSTLRFHASAAHHQ